MKANEPAVYGVTKIAQLFPSIRKIKNKALREKVAAVWSEAVWVPQFTATVPIVVWTLNGSVVALVRPLLVTWSV